MGGEEEIPAAQLKKHSPEILGASNSVKASGGNDRLPEGGIGTEDERIGNEKSLSNKEESVSIPGNNNSSHSTDTLPTDEPIARAVQAFREKMYAANKQFLLDRIQDIEALNLPTEEEKVEKLRRFWCKDCPYEYLTDKSTRLDDIQCFNHGRMDGIFEPSYTTDAQRRIYIEELERACTEEAKANGYPDACIRLPDEFKSFIKFADGVTDPDFRHLGICSWDPASGFEKYFKHDSDNKDNKSGNAKDGKRNDDDDEYDETTEARIRERLRAALKECNFDDPKCSWVNETCQVVIDAGEWHAPEPCDWMWMSFYAYCQVYGDCSNPTCDAVHNRDLPNNGWAWRILITTSCDGMASGDTDLFWDSIPEFLEWYASWPDRLDVDELKSRILDEEYE